MRDEKYQAEALAFSIRFKEAIGVSEARDWTQRKQAEFLDISTQQINNYTKGHRLPSVKACLKICDLTGVSFQWLMTGTTHKGFRTLADHWRSASREERESLLSSLVIQSDTDE